MSVDIHHGDCLDVMARLAGECVQVDSIVTDPPYHLTSIVKRFGADNAAPAKVGKTGAYARASAGFMGKKWDGGDVAFRPETWRLAYDVLKPGGHLIAFGGTRTYHRLACAIEDAGFEIRDQLQWLFGSGFPKSRDQAKAIDKHFGVEGETVPTGGEVRRIRPGADEHKDGSWEKLADRTYQPGQYVPATPEAAEWQGWGTALKPASEPIVLARKPLSEKSVAANVLRHGTGAVNVDGCRVEGPMDGVWGTSNATVGRGRMFNASPEMGDYQSKPHPGGRWPANVVHDGSDEVLEAFAAFGDGKGAGGPASGPTLRNGSASVARGKFNGLPEDQQPVFHGDTGTAARFFYSAKADSTDRLGSKHPTVKPVDLMRWLVRLVTPPGGTVLDPFAGTGTTGMACMAESFDAILIEREAEYVADIKNRIAHVSGHNTPLFAEVGP